jgi:hypothetical protein
MSDEHLSASWKQDSDHGNRDGFAAGQVWLEVQDQGNGGAPRASFRPVGLTGMQERVKDIGGVLEIKSDQAGKRAKQLFPWLLNSKGRSRYEGISGGSTLARRKHAYRRNVTSASAEISARHRTCVLF